MGLNASEKHLRRRVGFYQGHERLLGDFWRRRHLGGVEYELVEFVHYKSLHFGKRGRSAHQQGTLLLELRDFCLTGVVHRSRNERGDRAKAV